jgi:hypothetical protein
MSSPSPKSRLMPRRDPKSAERLGERPETIDVASRKIEAVYHPPPRYPIARLLIVVLRIFAIIVACLWPIESILIALVDEPYPGLARPLAKIATIVSLLVLHFLFLVGLLCWSELLQAFLDIAKNTEETARVVSQLVESRSASLTLASSPGHEGRVRGAAGEKANG